MSKKSKNERVKLPKRILGVKIPKPTRKSVNALLKGLPTGTAKPLLGAAVAALVTALAARLEEPLQKLAESYTADPKAKKARKGDLAGTTAH